MSYIIEKKTSFSAIQLVQIQILIVMLKMTQMCNADRCFNRVILYTVL